MKWEQTTRVSELVLKNLATPDKEPPGGFMRSPTFGGLCPIERRDRFCPGLVFVEFDANFAPGKTPKIILSGGGKRRIQRRRKRQEPPIIDLINTVFEPRIFNISQRFSGKLEPWRFNKHFEYFEGTRTPKINDPGLHLSIHADVKPKEEKIAQITLTITNRGPTKLHSILQGFKFNVKLENCVVNIPSDVADVNDIPLYVESKYAVVNLNETKTQIVLEPVGKWYQMRTAIKKGPSFEDSIKSPLPEGTKLPEDFDAHFRYAASIVTKAIQRFFKEKSKRYWQFQYDIKRFLYSYLIDCWRDGVPRAVVVNTPTATGKTEVYLDACIVASILCRRLFDDPGTVAVIAEPRRALTAEVLERTFRLLAYVNDLLPKKERITLGFYMGGIKFEPASNITLDDVPISHCPFCGEDAVLKLDFRLKQKRLIPICQNCKTEFDWVYLTEIETTGLLPNMIIATLDKLCYQVCRNMFPHAFFGREFIRCSKCGRIRNLTGTVIDGKVTCKCGSSFADSEIRRSRFSILVLDEPHSFKGSSGSNAGLFTTSELTLARQIMNQASLVIGSTATIRNPEELLRNQTGVREVFVFPPRKEEEYYFPTIDEHHRIFLFICSNIANRDALPRAVVTVKELWDQIRGPNDPKRLPQIVFTLRRQDADSLNNTLIQWGFTEKYDLKHAVIYGEDKREKIEAVLDGLRKNKIDVIFATLDLIALGIDIPSISVVHFQFMPNDYSKFIQGYGRSARLPGDTGLIFVWLRIGVPPEAYYLEHFRDLFLYKNQLLPHVPINRWFPNLVQAYTPAGALQFSLYMDRRGSVIFPNSAKKHFRSQQFVEKFKQFMGDVLSNPIYPEDKKIAVEAVDRGIHDLITYLRGKPTTGFNLTKDLMKKILPYGIRGTEAETIIVPHNFTKAMITSHIEETMRMAGVALD